MGITAPSENLAWKASDSIFRPNSLWVVSPEQNHNELCFTLVNRSKILLLHILR